MENMSKDLYCRLFSVYTIVFACELKYLYEVWPLDIFVLTANYKQRCVVQVRALSTRDGRLAERSSFRPTQNLKISASSVAAFSSLQFTFENN